MLFRPCSILEDGDGKDDEIILLYLFNWVRKTRHGTIVIGFSKCSQFIDDDNDDIVFILYVYITIFTSDDAMLRE